MFNQFTNTGKGYARPCAPTAQLRARKKFYQSVSMRRDFWFCGDERESNLARYIRVFGGVANFAYNLDIMREVTEPGSVTGTMAESVSSLSTLLLHYGIHAGVHSDDSAEQGEAFDVNATNNLIGCSYITNRQTISQLITSHGPQLIHEAMMQRPELFTEYGDTVFAKSVIKATERLAARESYFAAPPRSIAQAAIEHGAPAMVVKGTHSAKFGIINLVENTSIDSTQASQAGLAACSHDAWATEAAHDKLRQFFPYDKKQLMIAELIDTIGTMTALGVVQIETRRHSHRHTNSHSYSHKPELQTV